jgi:5'-methylthioadenosine phosphorylase
MSQWTLGVIGGSGLYEIDGLEDTQWIKVSSPWGEPSDELLTGRIGATKLVFLPRHGRGHVISPESINARANIDVLKRAGVTDILSINAVGSLREDLEPGDFALVSQYIDRTLRHDRSFFGDGLVAHISMADPVCPRLSAEVAEAARRVAVKFVDGATHVVIEGPQFSTRAESQMFRSWGCDVVGMTALPEARLAREAELPYANLCMVTDYDCWRESEEADVAKILAVMRRSADKAKALIKSLAAALNEEREPSPIDTCHDAAIITDPAKWDPRRRAMLGAICARRFSKV